MTAGLGPRQVRGRHLVLADVGAMAMSMAVDGTTFRRDTYPVPARWRLVVERTPLVPRSFFEALYLCRP